MPDLTLNASPFASQSFANISLFDSLIQIDLEDPQLRMCGWEKLKEKAAVGPLNIPMMMRQVEQEVLASGKPLLENVNELFEKFAARLAPEFETAQVPAADRKVTELQLNTLQERLREHYENVALETIWHARLHWQLHTQGAFLRGHQAIRKWLNDPINQPRIQQITQFGPEGSSLSGLRLRALPPEIGLFTGLTTLDLSDNQLDYLPESLGNLQSLTELSLSNNQLVDLPVSLGNLQSLTHLFLNDNRLTYLPEFLGNLKTLRTLSLFNNQLVDLPESLSNLQALTELSLSNNRLTSLPKSLGNLQALSVLYLSNNRLTSLPKSFGNLQALSALFFSNNQLVYLPESFGNLKALRVLHLSGNQLLSLPESLGNLQALSLVDLSNNRLASLPKSLGNLQALNELFLSDNKLVSLPEPLGNFQALTWFDLNANPLMLASDKECNKIADYGTYLALLEPLKKYTPQSPLATLFHAIIFNKPAEAIQQAFAQLSPDMQLRIANLVAQKLTGPSVAEPMAASSSSDPSLSQDILFTDMGLFARSVRRAAFDRFESLAPDQKNGVYYHVWDLAGRPETDDPQWGEHHAFDHMLCFVDALERTTTN